MSPGVEARISLSFEVPSHWRRWLGELQTKSLEKANVVIAATLPSQAPHVLDAETEALNTTVTAHFYALLLEGVPDYQDALVAFGGQGVNEGLSVQRVDRIDTAVRHRLGKRLEVDQDVVSRAGKNAIELLALHRSKSFRRVRAGFRACIRAIQTPEVEGRLHQFVRAVDGLMHLPKGQGRKGFMKRAPTFVQGSKLGLVLEQLYDLRNAHEHLNDFREALNVDSQTSFQQLVSLRAYQAERMALACYRRLLSRPDLLARFEDDDKADSFWTLSRDERANVWGEPLDLEEVQQEHDYRSELLGWDE